ncbi:hypothetical protein J5X84_02815 [Streptosporangiaceae bacterium NEAU-GS5]|nr:hypothetical protein [Streptosporangiaceae bacterium NEAU-GS5]
MTDGRGTPGGHEPRFIRSYDAPTTPLPRVEQPITNLAPPPPPPEPSRMGLRVAITAGAGVVAVLAIFLFFTAFGGDEPSRNATKPSQVQSPSGALSSPAASASPSPVPLVLPKAPASKPLTVFPGAGTTVASVVSDTKSGISYAMFGSPWKKAKADPFAYAQKSGAAVIVSSPLPGVAPAKLATYADYRAAAQRAVRWTMIHRQPQGAKFAWIASQQARYGMGWLLGYKISYLQDGKRRTSTAIVIVLGNGRAKPAMLFASVPSTHAPLYRDLDMLLWTARPLSSRG